MARKQSKRRGDKRTERIYVRVSREEKERITLLAHERNETVSRIVTDLIRQSDGRRNSDAETRRSPMLIEMERIRSQIWHIGHNVNQVARFVNLELGVTHEDVIAIQTGLESCERLLAELDRLISRTETGKMTNS